METEHSDAPGTTMETVPDTFSSWRVENYVWCPRNLTLTISDDSLPRNWRDVKHLGQTPPDWGAHYLSVIMLRAGSQLYPLIWVVTSGTARIPNNRTGTADGPTSP